MASNLELVRPHGSMRERLIVALDVGDLGEVKVLVKLLASEVGMLNVGRQLFTHASPQAVRLNQPLGGELSVELHFYDIPNTLANAVVDATGSLEMMRVTAKEARRVCHQQNLRKAIMVAVTVLTSLNQDDLKRVGVDGRVADQVVRLALLTKEAGMDGVVASPHEVADIRSACGRRFVIVTPVIRPRDAGRNDQPRVMTPDDAIQTSVDYIVVGRPILAAKDPVAAARKIIAEMQGAGR